MPEYARQSRQRGQIVGEGVRFKRVAERFVGVVVFEVLRLRRQKHGALAIDAGFLKDGIALGDG